MFQTKAGHELMGYTKICCIGKCKDCCHEYVSADTRFGQWHKMRSCAGGRGRVARQGGRSERVT
eukprot:129719-Rhodomonas_salina.2